MASGVSLSVWDYLVFVLMLILSSAIGIYYGYKGRQKSTKEYLTASGSMHWLPISVSLLASFLSAIALMGIPSEIYTYGIQYFITYLSFVAMLLLSAWIYAPIFYQTKVTSANEYLEKRFSKGVRLVGCSLFILQYVLYLAVVIFAPSLALQAVAGVPMAASIISTGAVCTFYTTLGGMRGVVWTDVLQATIMILGLLVVIGKGSSEVGGILNALVLARDGKRMTLFDFDPDPTVRNTFWTLVVGGTFSLISNWTTSQVVVQRFLSASSLKSVKKALYYNVIFLFIFMVVCCLSGLVMYAVYGNCDPRTAGLVKSNDQIIPYFVVHKLSNLNGIPGLYMACIFSGALSTASSGLNSLTAVTLEDIVKRRYPDMSERRAMVVSKCIACGYGLIVIAVTFLVSTLGTLVLQLTYSITGIIGAPNFGMFTLGMFSRRANSKGAYCGVLVGVIMTTWISLGAIIYPGDKAPAPVSIAGCQNILCYNGTQRFTMKYVDIDPRVLTCTINGKGIKNETFFNNGTLPYKYNGFDFPAAKLYRLSHLWYGAIGASCSILIGWLVSLATSSDEDSKKIDPNLLFDYAAFFRKLWPSKAKQHQFEYDIKTDESVFNLKDAQENKALEMEAMAKGSAEEDETEESKTKDDLSNDINKAL